MPRACPCCHEHLPADAVFCIACGASVRPVGAHLPTHQPSATGPTIRLSAISPALIGSSSSAPAARPRTAAHAAIWWCVRGTVSMLFSIGFVIGLARYLTMAWSHPLGWWPVVVVVSGALVALRTWVRG